jgi:hypothetical protein
MKSFVLLVMLGNIMLSAQSNPAARSDSSKPGPKTQARILETYGKLPLSFEENQGQTDAQVKFVSRGSGYTLFLTADEAVLSLHESTKNDEASPTNRQQPPLAPTANPVLRMKLYQANPSAKVTGADELPGKTNYFIGNDSKKWHTNVPTYAKVKYQNIYSGIDLVYYGNQRQLEYDFVVAPGADPRRIQFDVRRASKISTDKNGDLVFRFRDRELRWRKPVVFQETDGTRQTIEGSYVVRHGRRVGFALGEYDSRRTLIIDPAIAYSTYLGGATNFSEATAVAVDASGNAYLTGNTRANDFPVTQGAFQTTCPDYGKDCSTWGAAFITKMNPGGSALVYSTYLGGNEGAQGSAIAIDAAGNAYVTGFTYASNFPTTPGAYQTTCSGCGYYQGLGDAFVTELNPKGSALVYSTYLGGNFLNQAYNDTQTDGIAIDASGSVYVVGYTNFGGFPVTRHAFQRKCGSCKAGPSLINAFVTKFNPTLSELVYSTFLGGSKSDYASSMALDAAGDLYLTGTATSTNFPVTKGAFQTTCNSPCWDIFVTELNPAGSDLVYSTYLGGSIPQGAAQWGSSIALDAAGDAYVTGETGAPDFPTTPGSFQTTCHACTHGGGNAFVTEFNSAGSALVYSTYLGGSTSDQATSIVLDTTGDAYLSGETSSTDFPTTPGAFDTCSGCNGTFYSGFFSEINPTGSALVYSTYLAGSAGFTSAWHIAADATGGTYVVGSTSSTDFPITPGAFQTTCAGGCNYSNAFVTKFVPGDQVWPLSLNFGNQGIGIPSQPLTSTLSNSGSTALAISSIKIIGTNAADFAETNNCGTSLPAGGVCNINVTFTPMAVGNRAGTVTVTDGAANSPQTVQLVGVGTPPAVTLSPTNLSFGNETLGIPSQPQSAMLTNSGTGLLTISSIQVTGANKNDFAEKNNCPHSVRPNDSCTITVTFTPSALGNRNAAVTITDNAPDSPQTLPLSGVGVLPAVMLSPVRLTFPTQLIFTASNPKPVTLTNTGLGVLLIGKISMTGEFTQTNDCGNSVPSGAYCTINIRFQPQKKGVLKGKLSIMDNAPGSPQEVSLTGTSTYVQLLPAKVNFGTQPVGTKSLPKTITLTNKGDGPVNIHSISVTGLDAGDFAEKNNCGKQVASGASCFIKVTFKPLAKGKRTAEISVSDDGGGSPQRAKLAGTGT